MIRDDTGAPVRMVGVCTDITQRRAGEAERARLLGAERAARREAETSAARLDTLQRVTAELSRAVALDDVVDVVLGTAVRELGGQTGSLCLREGDDLVIAHDVGYPRDVTEHWGRFPSPRTCRPAKRFAPAERCSSARPKSGIAGIRFSPPHRWYPVRHTRSCRLPTTIPPDAWWWDSPSPGSSPPRMRISFTCSPAAAVPRSSARACSRSVSTLGRRWRFWLKRLPS